MRRGAIFLSLMVSLVLGLRGLALARMEYSLPGDRRLLVEGTIWNQSLIRSDDFKLSRQFDLVSQRTNAQAEITVENLIRDWGFIDKVDLFAIVRPVYEGIYDLRNSSWGDEGPGSRLIFRHGPSGPGFPGFQILPDGTPFHPPGPLGIQYTPRPNGKHPIFKYFNFNPMAHGRTKLRGAVNGLTNFENTENNLKWDHTDSNDENELREIYLDITMGRHWLRLGKQQIVWGKTDFFRSQDIVNPLDLGWHGFYESWEDIRIPQWMLRYQYQLGNIGPLSNMAIELVWNFDDFQPLALGAAGSPWSHPFSAGLNWFSTFNSAAGGFFPDPNTGQMRYYVLPVYREKHPSWAWKNMEWGGRLEWMYKGWRFAITEWYGWQDDAVFNQNVFYTPDDPHPLLGPWGGAVEVTYTRNNTVGMSADYFWEWASTVVRIESSYTNRAKVVASGLDAYNYPHRGGTWTYNFPRLWAATRVVKWSIGLDRPTYIPWINPTKSTFLSFQVLATHLLDHVGGEYDGISSPEEEFTFTFVAQNWYWRDQLIPQAWVAFLPTHNAEALTGGFNIEWLISDHWSVKAGVNLISGRKNRRNFGNNFLPLVGGPDTIPFAYGVPPIAIEQLTHQEAPFGLVRENFGAYRDRDEVFFKMQYRF